ncbi:retrovirus-related pol polyprotein from transposon TNT 1-94 [Tanacetum coccineum]
MTGVGRNTNREFTGCDIERRNRTLVEAARTMLIFLRVPEFLWAEAIATACFTQNHSLVHTRYNKMLYELIKGGKPNVQYFHVFGSLCYMTNYRDDLGKIKPKVDIDIFIGYSESSRGTQSQVLNFQDLSEELNEIPSKEELDNLFDTPSSSSIIVEEYEAPQLVSSSDEPIENEPTTSVSDNHSDELVHEDVAE